MVRHKLAVPVSTGQKAIVPEDQSLVLTALRAAEYKPMTHNSLGDNAKGQGTSAELF